jgi:diguanylate cyclase (GGDEF)-like protein
MGIHRILQRLEGHSKAFWGVIGVVMTLLIGMVDLLTGHDLAFSLFYLLPVSAAAWYASPRLGYTMAGLCAVTLCAADVLDGPLLPNPVIYVWNMLIVAAFFVVVTALLAALRLALERERQLARTDFLTGALNVRAFAEVAHAELSRARRYHRPLSIAYLDLDDFKLVNDRLGHSVGNQVLRAVVHAVRRNLRVSDAVARLGGDEFALLLPETGEEAVRGVVPKVQKSVLDHMARHAWPVTLSIGVLTCERPPATVDELLRQVDALMYEVKNGGKNGVRYAACASPVKDGSARPSV